jgi:hypothetical protein
MLRQSVTDDSPAGMTPLGLEWRQAAERLGCKIYYADEPSSTSLTWGYAPDEDGFQVAKAEHPDWFVLNDAKSYAPKYPLTIHHCGCWRLRGATTRNWPKIIAEKRESLEAWAREYRPDNPVLTCSACFE